MALENLTPENRVERLLSGADLDPATRLEYFLKQAGSGGSGSVEYEPVLAETTKSVNEHGWTTSFSGGPIFEGTSYRVTVNGVTYEPLIGTAGELSYICLGNTYVDDADPSGDYPFGIFYKNGTLTAWLETGDSITMQIDQIITEILVPAPRDSDIGKVLTVVSQSETGAEAIPAQTVTIAQGTATVQNANVSQWTEGQSLQVIYRGTTYTGQITDAEGSLVFGTADFALSYDSSTGVLTVEDNEHSGDNTISAQYVTEHAHADWAEPSGGSGQSVLVATVEYIDNKGVLDKTWLECKNADAVIIRALNTLDPNEMDFFNVLSIKTVEDLVDPTQISYGIDIAHADTSVPDEIVWSMFRLSTDTETGYPEITFE